MFEGVSEHELDVEREHVYARVGGSGPPLLLLHGYPESASDVARRRAGARASDSRWSPPTCPATATRSGRRSPRITRGTPSGRWRADLVAAMAALGHERSRSPATIAAARVGYRMALDHPDVVTRLAVIDIVPTGEVWARADATMALGYWHWAFLAQPAPLPERLIGGDPDAFWLAAERIGLKPGDPATRTRSCGVPRPVRRPGDDHRDVRGLSRRRERRPRARRGRSRPAHDRLPGARCGAARARSRCSTPTRSSRGAPWRPTSPAARSRARRTSSSRTRRTRSRPS